MCINTQYYKIIVEKYVVVQDKNHISVIRSKVPKCIFDWGDSMRVQSCVRKVHLINYSLVTQFAFSYIFLL